MAQQARGKRGSARAIYYYVELRGRIYLLLAFAKNVQGHLSAEQKKAVKRLVEDIERET